MADDTCELPDCRKPRYQNKRYCGSHFMKNYRYGDPYYVAPPTYVNLVSQRFGLLTVLRRQRGRWLCRCECGTEIAVRAGDLNRSTRTCGDRRHQWQDDIAYGSAHDRVRNLRGSASSHTCVDCGSAAAHWSYDHADPAELFEQVGRYVLPYSLDVTHYEPRCVACHRRFDRREAVAAG